METQTNAAGRALLAAGLVAATIGAGGCATTGVLAGPPVTRLITMFEMSPWLNLDRHRDPKPEGLSFILYLWSDQLSRGVHREGTLHIELYRRMGDAENVRRELVDTYTYSLKDIHRSARPNAEFGDFYLVSMSWMPYDLAGRAIEIIVRYQDPAGRIVREAPMQKLVPAQAFR